MAGCDIETVMIDFEARKSGIEGELDLGLERCEL
jgi:hypothetical protein